MKGGSNGPLRQLSDEELSRATGASLIPGNCLRILRDAQENYPAWEGAIQGAQKTIHLEMYIIHNDKTGRNFRDLLVAKAREGVKVRVIYDWFGSLSLLGGWMWKPLREAGGEVRVANPPGMSSFFGWFSRDHRKLITVDHSQAFISGLCIGDAWIGNPKKKIPPWRDTGAEICGPAVADVEAAFADAWKLAGGMIPPEELPRREDLPKAGSVSLRIVPASPETTGIYRLDLMLAASVRETLWLTDAYFIATSALYTSAPGSGPGWSGRPSAGTPWKRHPMGCQLLAHDVSIASGSGGSGLRVERIDGSCQDSGCGWTLGPDRFHQP